MEKKNVKGAGIKCKTMKLILLSGWTESPYMGLNGISLFGKEEIF